MNGNPHDELAIREMLKSLSASDFKKIGMNEIAYVRPLMLHTGKKAIAIYAADGTQLSVLETIDMAMETLRHNDLISVTLH